MKKLLGTLLSVLMIVTCVCLNTNIKVYAIPAEKVSTAYVNAAGVAQASKECEPVTESMTSLGANSTETWYVANEDVEVGSLTVNGNVNLILVDGKALTITYGISLSDGSSLTIYGQKNGSGTLNSKIINNDSASNTAITINGGTVNATSSNVNSMNSTGAINASSITINGGKVTVTSNETGNNFIYGYGIYANNSIAINGGTITVNGTATSTGPFGGAYGYGIYAVNDIAINGGNVDIKGTAVDSSEYNASNAYGMCAENGNIKINGGTITAKGEGNFGDGICAAYRGASSDYGNISINNGIVTASGLGNTGRGIYATRSITINDGTTKAKGPSFAIYSANSSLTINVDKLSVDGANETYVSGVTSLTNKTGTEYVTITPITPAGGNGNNNSGGNAGESTNKKVVNTSVK